jgi:hypothetical protein
MPELDPLIAALFRHRLGGVVGRFTDVVGYGSLLGDRDGVVRVGVRAWSTPSRSHRHNP